MALLLLYSLAARVHNPDFVSTVLVSKMVAFKNNMFMISLWEFMLITQSKMATSSFDIACAAIIYKNQKINLML